MDVKCGTPPIALSQDAFHKLDYQIMRLAFNLHTEMGNLWHEKEYQSELAMRCRSMGLDAFEEVPVSIHYNGFRKTYFLDLLASGSVYELKTASVIAENHEAQTLNYLFLTNTQHGKIINFRQDSLTWRFVSTSLFHENRMGYSKETSEWHPSTEQSQGVLKIMESLLANWGAYLSTHLYKEALCYFIGISIANEHERFVPLSPETILHMSALSKRKNNLRNNLQKYLSRSNFNELLWINFNQNQIEFSCLHNSACK